MNIHSAVYAAMWAACLPAHSLAQVQNPGNGHWYETVSVATAIDWNQASATASASVFMGMPGHLVTISDQAENVFVRGSTPVSEFWIGGWQDLTSAGFSEPAGGWVWVTEEPMIYTNWNAPNEPSNCGGMEDEMTMRAIGTWNDEGCSNVFAFTIEYEPGPGTPFCPLTPNSAGAGAAISAAGGVSVQANDLSFMAGPMAVGEPGIFYYGPDQLQVPFGNGNRCVGGSGGTIVRMFPFVVADATGFMSYAFDNTGPPHIQVVPGATLNFQAWFRDPAGGGAGFNLSDGLAVMFTP